MIMKNNQRHRHNHVDKTMILTIRRKKACFEAIYTLGFILWQFLICFWVGHHSENMRDLLKVFVLRFTTKTVCFIRCLFLLAKANLWNVLFKIILMLGECPRRLATMSFRALDRNCPWCIRALEHLFRVNRSVNWQLRRKFLNNSEQSDKMVHASLETSVSSRP